MKGVSSQNFWTVTISQRMPKLSFLFVRTAGLSISPAQPCVPSERSMSFLVWRHPPAPGSLTCMRSSCYWVGDGVTGYLISVLALALLKSTVSHRPDLVYSLWDDQSDLHL